ncbi:hypothetical protein EZS27_009782 [termite gut metagenome]|uniref:Uncharacterized protein n=1 Tax=termite gut metagenome TaxID=433724 RepID=A0A5J4S9C4_9ZZZZ
MSKITPENLETLLVAINKTAMSEGLEDMEKLRQDSTAVETNIHCPASNSLVWDCIKESHRLLRHLHEEIKEVGFREYTKNGKKTFFLIKNTKSGKKDKRNRLPISRTNEQPCSRSSQSLLPKVSVNCPMR